MKTGPQKYFYLACVLLAACNQNNSKPRDKFYQSLPDTVNTKNLIAAYAEDGNTCLILWKDKENNQAEKIVLVSDKSVMCDSLVQINESTFHSKRRPMVYVVNDSLVNSIYEQKIIHPSSNWQGQTPGQQSVVTIYERIDR